MTPIILIEPAPTSEAQLDPAAAALRRLAGLTAAEAAKRPTGGWLHQRLVADIAVGGCGDLAPPELCALMRQADAEADPFVHVRDADCPPCADEKAALRRACDPHARRGRRSRGGCPLSCAPSRRLWDPARALVRAVAIAPAPGVR